jgi:hypothetical protein
MKTSGTHTLLHKTVLLAAVGTALYFVLTTLIGMVNSYTPVPYWDMWGGTLGFYIAHRDGDTSIWWSQHNEHRIVLSRILFWVDYELFSGNSVFLFVMNAVLAFVSTALFYLFSRDLLATRFADQQHSLQLPLRVFTALICAWLFQWMQDENFAWAFQSQFFLAQLMPLVAFYLLSRAVNGGTDQRLWFIAACVAGVASAGTMANGILALPLMTLYVLAIRQSRVRVALLAVVSLLTLFLYFFDYASPGSHGAGDVSAFAQPLLLIRYVFLYLGTPFYLLFGEADTGMTAALIATSVMAVVSITFLIITLRDLWIHRHPADAVQALTLALVFYIIYLVGTAFGTGSGRLIFGVNQALSHRYTTPALMAWSAVFVLLLPLMFQHWRAARWALIPAGAGLMLLMVTLQWQALAPRHNQVFAHKMAGLALEMDIRDEAQINAIYEMSGGLLNVANIASQYDLTMFGMSPWQNLRELPGSRRSGDVPAPQQLPACLGHIDLVSRIPGESRFYSVEGWMLDPISQTAAGLIEAQTIDGIVSGFGLSGYSRPDVAAAINVEAIQTGFKAYLRTQDSGQALWLIAEGGRCALPINTTVPD